MVAKASAVKEKANAAGSGFGVCFGGKGVSVGGGSVEGDCVVVPTGFGVVLSSCFGVVLSSIFCVVKRSPR